MSLSLERTRRVTASEANSVPAANKNHQTVWQPAKTVSAPCPVFNQASMRSKRPRGLDPSASPLLSTPCLPQMCSEDTHPRIPKGSASFLGRPWNLDWLDRASSRPIQLEPLSDWRNHWGNICFGKCGTEICHGETRFAKGAVH